MVEFSNEFLHGYGSLPDIEHVGLFEKPTIPSVICTNSGDVKNLLPTCHTNFHMFEALWILIKTWPHPKKFKPPFLEKKHVEQKTSRKNLHPRNLI